MNISFKREPVAWVNAIKLCIVAGMAFGLKVTMIQLAAVVAALESIGFLVIRQNVYAPVNAEGAPVLVADKPAPVADPAILQVESDPASPRLKPPIALKEDPLWIELQQRLAAEKKPPPPGGAP